MKNSKENKSKFNIIIIIGVLIIPFMYSFFYLKAFWDPYKQMNEIPVAIVNLDKEVENTNKGKELINNIKKSDSLKISVVNKEKAKEGLDNKKYYAIIEIPEDFTNNLLNSKESNRQQATITYSPNQKSNYLASQIISRVVLETEKKLNGTISKTIVGNLVETVQSVPVQLEEISNGINEMSEGTSKLESGAKQISSSTNTLDTSYNEFNEGVSTLKEGTNKLKDSQTKFNSALGELEKATSNTESINSSINQILAASSNITNNISSFDTKLNDYVSGIDQTLTVNQTFIEGIISLGNSNPQLLSDENFQKLYYTAKKVKESGSIDKLKVSGSALKSVSSQISGGMTKFNENLSGLNQIPTNLELLSSSTKKLKSASDQILNGANDLNNGMLSLYENSLKIKSGISSLNNANTTLYQGISTLNSSVSESNKTLSTKINDTKKETDKLNGLDTYSESPVNITEKDQNKVSAYGTAFAPYFISISLWVGSLMLFIILYYDVKDRFKIFSRNNKNTLQRTFAYMLLATLQALILGTLLIIGLDFKITNIFLYYFSLILTANTFILIIEFLIVNFKDVGKFLALVMLVLQLAASGGTFPIETVPKFFQSIYNFMPMKYTINVFRESLITIENSLLGKNILVVVLLLMIFLILNVIKDIKSKKESEA